VTALELSGVSVAYDGTPVLRGVGLRLGDGDWLGLIGPNGAGKTTLLRAVVGLVPHDGSIGLGGVAVSGLGKRRLARAVAFVPQRPTVPASMPVSDYVLLGRTPYISYLGAESRSDLAVVSRVLERLELSELADRPLGSLSGGEVQRAVLGRALAQEAGLLLLDEPTAALDVGHQQQVLELVDELRAERGLTVVSAMHDLTMAAGFADRLLLLAGGRAVAEGTAGSVLTEAAIRQHYGAAVRVMQGPGGEVFVIPTRADR
jgi:iron complex transport system ATP-binding protein